MMNLGRTRYLVIGDYGNCGIGNVGEDMTDEGDVFDALAEFLKDGDEGDFRVIRIDLAGSSNLPEHTADETEYFRDQLIHAGIIDDGVPVEFINDHHAQERHGWEQV